MKVLLDEQLPHRLRTYLGAHEVYTVDYMGWAGLKNGELLRAAEADGFEVFLTGDKKLPISRTLASAAWPSLRFPLSTSIFSNPTFR